MPPTSTNIYPTLRYRDAPAAIAWLCDAFGFHKVMVVPGEQGTVAHAELSLGDGVIMLGSFRAGDAEPSGSLPMGAEDHGLCIFVDDPDAHYARAKAAGADITLEIENTDYGSRGYSVRDLEGHLWTFGTYRPELERAHPHPPRVTAYLCAKGASDAIEFYKKAFGAKEQYRMANADGAIGHATLSIGDTTLYISDEAPQFGVFSPKSLKGNSCSFVLAVDDVDAAWGRAIGAGATVERPITDAPYGRGGWVVDPFGHRWNLMAENPGFKPEVRVDDVPGFAP
ncbi:MAG TPA: VOC family protein [Dehalococcoidia bacterium]|nr:VOC family protein [Dehalococcoidia bacterium]